jgi:hypothetical protein
MHASREIVFGAFVLATLTGCGTLYENIEVSDRTTLPTLRISKQV